MSQPSPITREVLWRLSRPLSHPEGRIRLADDDAVTIHQDLAAWEHCCGCHASNDTSAATPAGSSAAP
ncbi:hypothetical protein [Mangrovactinospora gilvigrisea]|uniref:hypothetical protein n=1 Tax=Mangrovactinospora gilvigrisea TaxID=1428644 RepID=UPI000A43F644|nr:hypothetical protein [Mangrovactinospora gilvigrisea]